MMYIESYAIRRNGERGLKVKLPSMILALIGHPERVQVHLIKDELMLMAESLGVYRSSRLSGVDLGDRKITGGAIALPLIAVRHMALVKGEMMDAYAGVQPGGHIAIVLRRGKE